MTIERHFKVVGGKDVKEPSPPNPYVVELLEEALDLARKGVIQEVHLCGISDDSVALQGYSRVKSVYTMLGALTQAVTDYQNREIHQFSPETL